jgi:hypothetical protein
MLDAGRMDNSHTRAHLKTLIVLNALNDALAMIDQFPVLMSVKRNISITPPSLHIG